MLKAYHDKETEFNWEAREKAISRMKGLLRGNATEPAYLDVLVHGIKQMVDGIIKAVESLRTQLAVKALSLVGDIGVYIGKHIDSYITEQLLMCMMRCASLTKKMVANASLEATKTLLKHTHFYPKFMNMLLLSITDKNSQVRLYVVIYTKTLLEAHAHREHTRTVMDRTNSTDHFETLISKGLNDPTPMMLSMMSINPAFSSILRQLPPMAQKQLEKSKIKPQASKSTHESSNRHLSPSNSSNSTGSTDPPKIKRSLSPRASSPHLRSAYTSSSPPSSSHLQIPSSPPLSSMPSVKKTRVPTLNRKKSALSLNKRKAPANFMMLLSSEDELQRAEGLVQLAKKLSAFPYHPQPNLATMQLDVPNAPPVDGIVLKATVLQLWDDHYDFFVTWDGLVHIMMRLLTFEESIPKLILDAHPDENVRRVWVRDQHAKLGLARAKLFLESHHPDLVDILFSSLVHYGGFVQQTRNNKKDITRLPANRRKLTKAFLEWLDDLVTPLIGLKEDVDPGNIYEGVPDGLLETSESAALWFASDQNLRQCFAILLPLILTSASGTLWHDPLIAFVKHLRLLNQRLFEMIMATYDDHSTHKICRTLGIHLRVDPVQLAHEDGTPSIMITQEEEPMYNVAEYQMLDEDLFSNITDLSDDPLFNEPLEETVAHHDLPRIEEQPEDYFVPHAAPEPAASVVPSESFTPTEPITPTESTKPITPTTDSITPTTESTPPTVEPAEPIAPTESTASTEPTETTQSVTPTEPVAPIAPTESIVSSESAMPTESTTPTETTQSVTPTEPVAPIAPTESIVSSESAMPTESTTPTETTQSSPRLEKSYPNPDKYPVPQSVPFYRPERVNFPHPVFKQNIRSLQSTHQPANRAKDKAVQLYGLIDKLKSPASSVEHQNTFRKMTRLFKEVPIRRIWNQGGIEESGSETWAGAQNDAGNFVETVQAVLPFLDGDNEKSSLTAIECIRQLAVTQAGLFRFFERKVDDEEGRTLESQLLEKLLKMRSSRNPTICIAAEDTLDSILGTLNAPTVFELLMAFIIYRLLIVPFEDYPVDIRYHPVGSAFMYLGRWVRELKDDFYIDEWLGKGGVNAFFEVKKPNWNKSHKLTLGIGYESFVDQHSKIMRGSDSGISGGDW
ncbi:clasp N terminal-domain-containing protein [Choanephora cucurbitarum]|nr:clasp N terminal-domain-containing protein [Choanephora cucurbitarum]